MNRRPKEQISNGGRLKRFKSNIGLTAIAVPGFIWFVIFSYIPLIGLLIAFKDYRIYGTFIDNIVKSKWSGLKNFEFLFATNDAGIMIRNTILYNVIFIVLNIIVPLILAIMINSIYSRKLTNVYQTLIFFPYFLSWVAINYFVFAFLSPDKGLVNNILINAGLDKHNWYAEPKLWPALMVMLNTWKGLGYNIVIFLATIMGIDKTYYEAASLDGATKLQQARFITVPLVRGLVAVLFLLGVGKIFNSDIGLFFNVTRDSGAIYDVTQTIDTYVYRTFKTLGNISLSSAAATFQSVVGFVIIVISNLVVRKIDRDSALF